MFGVNFGICFLISFVAAEFLTVESYQTVDRRANFLQKTAEKYYLKYESLDPLRMFSDNKDYVRKKRMQNSHSIFNMNEADAQKLSGINTSAEFLPGCPCGSADVSKSGFLLNNHKDTCVCSCCISSERAKLLREVISLITDVMKFRNEESAPQTVFHPVFKGFPRETSADEGFSREFSYDDLMLGDKEKQEEVALIVNAPKPDPVKDAEYEEQFTTTFRRKPNNALFGPNPKIHFTPAGTMAKKEMEEESLKAVLKTIDAQKMHQKPKMFNLSPFFYRKDQ